MFTLVTAAITGAIFAGILWGVYVLVRLAIRKPAPRKGYKFFLIAWAVIGTLAVIGAIAGEYNSAKSTSVPASTSAPSRDLTVEEVDVYFKDDGTLTREGYAQAAKIAWDEQDTATRVENCYQWGYNPSTSVAVWKAQGIEPQLIRAMSDLLDRECSAY